MSTALNLKFISLAANNGYNPPAVVTSENLAQIVTSKEFIDAFSKHLWDNGIVKSPGDKEYRHVASFWEKYDDEKDPEFQYGAYKLEKSDCAGVIEYLRDRIAKAVYKGTVTELLNNLSRKDPRANPFLESNKEEPRADSKSRGVEAFQCVKIFVKTEKHSYGNFFIISEAPGNVSLFLNSDYGLFGFSWWNIGEGTSGLKFLAECDKYYIVDKFETNFISSGGKSLRPHTADALRAQVEAMISILQEKLSAEEANRA